MFGIKNLTRETNKRIAWNKGLTKETDERVRKNVASMVTTKRKQGESGEVVPWNKGLTKETDTRVAKNAAGTKQTRKRQFLEGELTVWNKGLTKEQDPRVNQNANSLIRAYAEGRAKAKGHSTRGGYRNDLDHYVRSRWEANFARLLKFLGVSYKYEFCRFQFEVEGKTVTYLPDFYLLQFDKYVEVKGFWRDSDFRRVKLFCSIFPDIKLDIIDEAKYLELRDKFSKEIPNWEYS